MRLRKGRGQEKWAVKRGSVMQILNARDHVEVHPQKKKPEVLYLVKKQKTKQKTTTTEHHGYKL